MAEKEYIEREKIALTDFEIAMCKGSYKELCQMLLDKIKSIPATDVRPVVRGKWISTDDGKTVVRMIYGEPQDSCKCSVCGEWLIASDEYDVKGNFCPNCGADMREES